MTKSRDILKAMSIFGSAQGITVLLNLVRTKFIATIIGTTGVGINSLYFEARELLHLLTNLAVDVSGVRIISSYYEKLMECDDETEKGVLKKKVIEEVKLLRSLVLMLACIGALVSIVFSLPLSYLTFQDSNHILGFILLAPSVALTTMVCGEMAILKAMRKIKTIAWVSIVNVALMILTTIPIYCIMGLKGVLPVIFVSFLVQYVVTSYYSFRLVKPEISIGKDIISRGLPVIKLGFAIASAGVVARISQLMIRSFLNSEGGFNTVGLYSAGYTILLMLSSFVFSSILSDYYPRLAGAFNDAEERRIIVHKQIKMSLLVITPLIIVFVLALPILVPILLSHSFDDMVPMVQVAAFSLILYSFTQPYGMVPVAAGDSKLHFILEAYAHILIMICVCVGYVYYGLIGAGMGILIANVIDSLVLYVVITRKYGV